MKLRERPSETPELNLTPLIDVVFLLLIFFMVSTSFDQKQVEMKVELPEVGEKADKLSDIKSLLITVDVDGHFQVNDEAEKITTTEQLAELMQQAKKKNPKVSVSIAGDKGVDYQKVVRVMEVSRSVGLVNISLISRYKD